MADKLNCPACLLITDLLFMSGELLSRFEKGDCFCSSLFSIRWDFEGFFSFKLSLGRLAMLVDVDVRRFSASVEKPPFIGFTPLLFIVIDSFPGVMAGGTAAVLPPTEDSCMASDTVVMWKLFLFPCIRICILLRANLGNCFGGVDYCFLDCLD